MLSIGVLPAHEVYSRIPNVDWKFFVRHEKFTGLLIVALLIAAIVVFIFARRHYERFRARVAQGFAIMHDGRKLFLGVVVPQLLSWVFRIACVFFFLRAFHVHATLHNALLAQAVESLATLFPATPGGAGTKQGLIVYLFRGEAISRSLLLAFSVGMNLALVVTNLVCGLVAIASYKRLRVAEAPMRGLADGATPARRVAAVVTKPSASRRRTGTDGSTIGAGTPPRPARPVHAPTTIPWHQPSDMAYASVYPLVAARAVAREFTYEVGDDVEVGSIVMIPFGRSRARGIVVELQDAPPPGVDTRAAEAVVGSIPPALVELARWVADYYGSTPARALALVAPRLPKRRKEQSPPGSRQELADDSPAPDASPAQLAAVERIVAAIDAGGGNFLLHGVTGSGKTEVYLQACAAALERGLGAIVLVPEIALAPQTVGRFRARFGDRVAVLHSALSEAERRDERERIMSGEARIVVGARSAVFAPLRGLGLIVVDEEHDQSYKQDADPRYDARTVAVKRAALEGCATVFGSATPRPESWASLERLSLGGRIGAELPPVRIVDLRREAGYPLSAPLLAELRGVAERRSKAILLLNRRGIAPALHCRACGTTLRCPNCDVALVLHGDSQLRCHHCGHAVDSPELCPACGSPDLARLGAGTQRLERELARELPELELIRLDADAVSRPDELAASLRRFADAKGAVLLGTQMVAKGHHFEGVELAAVVDADTGLALPDFRAEERTFQLITQLAGRSGREAPGRVIVQTFQPDARPIVHAARHDVSRFLAEELARREALGYPPFAHIVRIVVAGPAPEPVLRALQELRSGIDGGELLGPAPLLRLRGRHRAQLVAKTKQPRRLATQAARLLAAAAPAMRKAGLTAVVDVDPQSL